jgi:hypothetical protein
VHSPEGSIQNEKGQVRDIHRMEGKGDENLLVWVALHTRLNEGTSLAAIFRLPGSNL